MARAFNTALRTKYVLESDRALPQEQQTEFEFRPILQLDWAHFQEVMADANPQLAAEGKVELSKSDTNLYVRAVVRRLLTGWWNFPIDDVGTQAPFKKENGDLTDDSLNCLSLEQTSELFNAMTKSENVTSKVAGKS